MIRLTGAAILIVLILGLVGCGGGGGGGSSSTPSASPPTVVNAPAATLITQNPQGLAVEDGTSATFSVQATGERLTYQWRRNGVPITSATTATYTLSPARLADGNATFDVVVMGTGGVATSTQAQLIVTPSAASVQPSDVSVAVGANASFSIPIIAGATALWQRSEDGGKTWSNIPGAAGFNYTVSNVALRDAGAWFRVAITHSAGVVMTPAAVLYAKAGIALVAGSAGGCGYYEGIGTQARFCRPYGLTFDSSGTLYVYDILNDAIRTVSTAGAVTTFARGRIANPSESGLVFDSAGSLLMSVPNDNAIERFNASGRSGVLAGGTQGTADGIGSAAQFILPQNVARDALGRIVVADTGANTIRRIATDGTVTTIGTGFNQPTGVAVAPDGSVVVADAQNQTIRRIDNAGTISTIAGTTGVRGFVDGPVANALFALPYAVAVASDGSIYVGDAANSAIRKIDVGAGTVSTIAGGSVGSSDGTGSAAQFSGPRSLALAPDGSIYVADEYNDAIRRVTTSGTVSTLAGLPASSVSIDATGATARFNHPAAVAYSPDGTLYIVDTYSHVIRALNPSTGVVRTLAGLAGSAGTADGLGSAARFNYPSGIAIDSAGTLYVTDRDNHMVRQISAAGQVTTIAGTAGQAGYINGPAQSAKFSSPTAIAVQGTNVYVYDSNGVIRLISGGTVTAFSGAYPANGTSSDGSATMARYASVDALVSLPDGSLIAADYNQLRRISPTGTAATVQGLNLGFQSISGLVVGQNNDLFVSDLNAGTVVRVTADAFASVVLGTASTGFPYASRSSTYTVRTGSDALINTVRGITSAPDGRLWILTEGGVYLVQ